MKTSDPDPMMGGYSMYTAGSSYHFLTTDPSTIALRLNALLVEAKDTVDLNTLKSQYKTKLFGNATFTRTGDDILISYPSNYHGADRDELRIGDIVVNTGGVMLNEPGAIWSVSAPTADANKAYRHAPAGSMAIYHEWDSYQIEQQSDRFAITFTNFLSYYWNNRDLASKWSGTFTIQLYDMDAPGYQVLMNQPRSVTSAETSGTELGSAATITYRVLEPLLYTPTEPSWYSMTSGKEYVSYPHLNQTDPRTYPAPNVTVTTTTNYVTITYNGMSQSY